MMMNNKKNIITYIIIFPLEPLLIISAMISTLSVSNFLPKVINITEIIQ